MPVAIQAENRGGRVEDAFLCANTADSLRRDTCTHMSRRRLIPVSPTSESRGRTRSDQPQATLGLRAIRIAASSVHVVHRGYNLGGDARRQHDEENPNPFPHVHTSLRKLPQLVCSSKCYSTLRSCQDLSRDELRVPPSSPYGLRDLAANSLTNPCTSLMAKELPYGPFTFTNGRTPSSSPFMTGC